ncbi:MAG: hypothetical protein WBA77_23120 [Microcoleaceae cyanobacterium]
MKVAVFTVLIVMQAKLVSAAPCKINQSVYRDAGGKGFELVFGESIPGTVSQATATIRLPEQGRRYAFNVVQSQGYGSTSLVMINPSSNGLEFGNSFMINFFDQNLRAANPGVWGRETQSPRYAFITGLGSHDYYTNSRNINVENAPSLIGDVMWIHDRCQ